MAGAAAGGATAAGAGATAGTGEAAGADVVDDAAVAEGAAFSQPDRAGVPAAFSVETPKPRPFAYWSNAVLRSSKLNTWPSGYHAVQ
jgi:hypothetical protein